MEPISLSNLILHSAVGTSIIKIVWECLTKSINFLEEKQSIFLYEKDVILDLDEKLNDYGKFYLLIIRYGTDQYIKDMANEKEKWIGRLRNKIISLESNKENGKVKLHLKIPVHKRLGTQFKLFYDAKRQKINIVESIFKSSSIQYSIASSIANDYRIFFLLKNFGTVKSVEGIENNICFPI